MNLVLCHRCAELRGAFGSNAHRYEEKAIGLWRGVCADCGARGSSGDPKTDLRNYFVHDGSGASDAPTMRDLGRVLEDESATAEMGIDYRAMPVRSLEDVRDDKEERDGDE